MFILIYFLGTGDTYSRYGAKAHSSKFKNIGIERGQSENDWDYIYYFNGPGIFNTLDWTTKKSYEAATKILPPAIKGMLQTNPNEKIRIYVRGHSRGGTVSVQFYRYLSQQFGTNQNIELILKNSDSYYGPTAKKENALIRLKKSDNHSNKIMVAYAVQTFFKCTPQQIVGADVVIIVNVGHNISDRALHRDNTPTENGLYLGETRDKDHYNFIKITQNNIKVYFDFIYKYGKVTQTNRWRLFTSILIQKLGIKSYDELETIVAIPKSILFPNVQKEFNSTLSSIRKSINLTIAFNTAIKLFSPGGIFSGMGGENFHVHLLNAKKCVCGVRNNDHGSAINELNSIINKNGRPETSIKTMTAQALIDRIKKWYNLQ